MLKQEKEISRTFWTLETVCTWKTQPPTRPQTEVVSSLSPDASQPLRVQTLLAWTIKKKKHRHTSALTAFQRITKPVTIVKLLLPCDTTQDHRPNHEPTAAEQPATHYAVCCCVGYRYCCWGGGRPCFYSDGALVSPHKPLSQLWTLMLEIKERKQI